MRPCNLPIRVVVESPFQVLMAIEAIAHSGRSTSDCELVLLNPSEAHAAKVFRQTTDRAPWGEIYDLGPRQKLHQISYIRQIRALSNGPGHALIIGDYFSPYMRHLANQNLERDSGRVTLVDDGRATLHAARSRLKLHQGQGTDRRGSGLRQIAERIAGIDGTDPRSLEFFSMFDLDTRSPDTFSANALSGLRAGVKAMKVDESVLLLGSPFVELDQMSESHYVDLVRRISDFHDGNLVLYPHRRERETKLAALRTQGVEVAELGSPIELHLLDGEAIPRRIESFFSTASFTLWKLFGDTCEFGTYQLGKSHFLFDVHGANDPSADLHTQSDGAIELITAF